MIFKVGDQGGQGLGRVVTRRDPKADLGPCRGDQGVGRLVNRRGIEGDYRYRRLVPDSFDE